MQVAYVKGNLAIGNGKEQAEKSHCQGKMNLFTSILSFISSFTILPTVRRFRQEEHRTPSPFQNQEREREPGGRCLCLWLRDLAIFTVPTR